MLRVIKEIRFTKGHINDLWNIYSSSFGDVDYRSPCKQHFEQSEFNKAMKVESVLKFILYDTDDIAGLGLITNDFTNMPWISSKYFEHRLPDLYSKGLVFYFMGIVVKQKYRNSTHNIFFVNELFKYFSRFEHMYICFDHSATVNPNIPKLLQLMGGKTVNTQKIESQNYYCAELLNS